MKHNLIIAVLLSGLVAFSAAKIVSGRGFGGGGGGGFHGGGGGGFGGGGGYHGGGGFGGGGGFDRGGGYGGGGFDHGGYGGGYGGGGYHGYGGGGDFHSGGFNNSGIGGEFGGDGIRGAGGLAGDGYRGAGGTGGFDRNLGGQTGGFRAGEFGPAPSASHLDSFLGLPTDMGMHQVSGEHAYGYSGSARGLSMNNPYVGGSERGVSGHEYTGPNGTTIAHGSIGERGAAVGPNGAAAGERGARGTVVEGPNGSTIAHGSAGERGVAVGPNGAAAGERGTSGTVARGANGGTAARGVAGERGVAAGPNGVAGGSRGAAVRGPNGNVAARGGEVTRDWSAADMRVQGNFARSNFHDWNAFGHNWYHDHPNAWYAAGFANGIWAAATWSSINGWFGADWPSYGYMYGNDLTYDDDNVLLYGQPIATAAEYYDSAENLAQAGEQADVANTPPPQSEQDVAAEDPSKVEWLPLGVFEAIPAGEKSSNMIFQLAVNKAGIIRGNYYDGTDKNVQLIQGSVDKETQRVAWVVADKKNIIFDCGLYNLTKAETPVLVHIDKDKNQQWTLVRMTQKPAATADTQQ